MLRDAVKGALAALDRGDARGARRLLMKAMTERRGRACKWPWDSIAVDDEFRMDGVTLGTARVSASRMGAQLGKRFRVTGAEGDAGFMVIREK